MGGGREMCDRKEEKRERVDGARRVCGLNVENASAEKRERDKEYTLRVRARYTRRAVGEDRTEEGGRSRASGPTVAAAVAGEGRAKKKRARRSRFNRKTSFIRRTFIVQ